MRRLQQHTKGRQFKSLAEHLLKRQHDGRDQVGAATDRLGQQKIGSAGIGQTISGCNHFVKTAAKTRAGDFTHGKSLSSQILGVDEISGLIVGDDPHRLAGINVTSCDLTDQSRFSGAKESA
jgi:hypothetical protein